MQQNIEIKETPVYHNLDEIRLRKAQLLTDIAKDNNRMRKLWNNLFHKGKGGKQTPSKRFSGLLSTGAGVLDGALLAWKLYRKFKR